MLHFKKGLWQLIDCLVCICILVEEHSQSDLRCLSTLVGDGLPQSQHVGKVTQRVIMTLGLGISALYLHPPLAGDTT